jgi:hypothetical protein
MPSVKVRRRVEEVMAAVPPAVEHWPLTGDCLRGVRDIEALERAGTAEARAVLRTWAEQARHSRLAGEAQAVIRRLGAAR